MHGRAPEIVIPIPTDESIDHIVYKDWLYAIEVVAFDYDDKFIISLPVRAQVDFIPKTTIARDGIFIYLLESDSTFNNSDKWRFVLARELNSPATSLRAYIVPKGARKVTIKYRIHYPQGRISRVSTVTVLVDHD